jgi:hypothetical protein
MTCITDFWNRLGKFEKLLVLFTISFAAGILVFICCYAFFGQALIEKIYYGQAPEVLNNLIKYQHKYPLEHYLSQSPLLFKRMVFLSTVIYGFIAGSSFFLYRLIFSDERAPLSIAVSLPILAVATLYYLNPSFRIFSFHGYYRAGIVYQILNGYVPPHDPLFADYTVQSPWGYAWVIAMTSKFFHISPFYSFALCNIICLILASLGIYYVAGLVCNRQKARLFSVLISIYAITPFPRSLLTSIQDFFHNQKTEFRATPIFMKFMTVNGYPVGIVFFILFIYATIKLLRNGKSLRYAILVLISFVGAGFLYAPVLPCMAASLVALTLLSFFPSSESFDRSWKKTTSLCLVLIIGIIILRPYFLTISSGVRSDIHFLNPVFVYKNTVNLLVSLLPLSLIIFWARKKLLASADRTAGMVLLTIIISLALCFIGVHILDSAEYKFLGLAGISIGILGGIAFENIAQKKKWATLTLICLFMLPSLNSYWKYLIKKGNKPVTSACKTTPVYEKGTQLFVRNPEEAQLYHWIRQNTSLDQLFIDSTLRLPIYAQRQLLVGIDGIDGAIQNGYGIDMDTIAIRNGYDKDEFNLRSQIVRNVYGLESTLDHSKLLEYLSDKAVLIIVRVNSLAVNFNSEHLHVLFRSSNGNYLIYSTQESFCPTPLTGFNRI